MAAAAAICSSGLIPRALPQKPGTRWRFSDQRTLQGTQTIPPRLLWKDSFYSLLVKAQGCVPKGVLENHQILWISRVNMPYLHLGPIDNWFSLNGMLNYFDAFGNASVTLWAEAFKEECYKVKVAMFYIQGSWRGWMSRHQALSKITNNPRVQRKHLGFPPAECVCVCVWNIVDSTRYHQLHPPSLCPRPPETRETGSPPENDRISLSKT